MRNHLFFSVFLLCVSLLWSENSIEQVFTYRTSAIPREGVWIVGDFNAWSQVSHPLKNVSPGVWEIILKLPPGEYRYLIRMDSRLEIMSDKLRVGEPWFIPTSATPKGDLLDIRIPSPNLSGEYIEGFLYLPPGDRSFLPLLILHHGNGGNKNDWVDNGCIPVIMDNLIHKGKIRPFAVFFPSMQAYRNYPGLSQALAKDIPNWLHDAYGINVSKKTLALGGVSMGGSVVYQALMDRQDVLGSYISLAGWLPELQIPFLIQAISKKDIQVYILCGSGDGLLKNSRAIWEQAQEIKEKITYTELAGGHTYECWIKGIPDLFISLSQSFYE